MNIGSRARAPVLNLQSTDVRWSYPARLAPSQFMNCLVTVHSQKIASANGGDYAGLGILQLPQTRPIQMIHVCVGEQDKIRHGQFQGGSRGMYQPLQADSERPDLDSNTRTEDGIGENCKAIHANQ